LRYCCEYFEGCVENGSFLVKYDEQQKRIRYFKVTNNEGCIREDALLECIFCKKDLTKGGK